MSGPTLSKTRAPPGECTLKVSGFSKADALADQRPAGNAREDVATAAASALKENGLKLCDELLKAGLPSPVFNKKYAEVVQKARAAFEAGDSEKGYAALSYVSVLHRIESVYSSFDQAKKENPVFLSDQKGLLHDYLKACLDPADTSAAVIKRLKPAADMMVSALEFLSQVPDSDEFLSTRTLIKDALQGLGTIDSTLPEDKLQGRLDNAQMRLRCAARFMEAQKLGYTLRTEKFDPAVSDFFALFNSNIRTAIDAVKAGKLTEADSALNRASLIEEPLNTVVSLSQELKTTPPGDYHDALQAAVRHFTDSRALLQKTFSQTTDASFADSWKELADHIGKGKELLDAAHKTDVNTRFTAVKTDPALEALRSSKAFTLLSSCIEGMQKSPPSLPEGIDPVVSESILRVFEFIGSEKNVDARRAYENALNAYAEKDTVRGNLWFLHAGEVSSLPALALATQVLKRGSAGGAWDGYKIRGGTLDSYASAYTQLKNHTAAVEEALAKDDLKAAASELRQTDISRTEVAGMNRCIGLLPSVAGAGDKETAVDKAFWQYSKGSPTEALITLGRARSDVALKTFSEFLADKEPVPLPDGKTRTKESLAGAALERAKSSRDNFDTALTYLDGAHRSRSIAEFYADRGGQNLGFAEGVTRACSIIGNLADAYRGLNDAEAILRKEWAGKGDDVLGGLAALRAGAKEQYALLAGAADEFNQGRNGEAASLLAKTDPVFLSRVSLSGSAAKGLIVRKGVIKSADLNAEAARKDPYIGKTDQAYSRNDRAWIAAQFGEVSRTASEAGAGLKSVISRCAQFDGGNDPAAALTEIRNSLSESWAAVSGAHKDNAAFMYCLRAMETEAVVASKAEETAVENSTMLASVNCSRQLHGLMLAELTRSTAAAGTARDAAVIHMNQIRLAGSSINVPRSADGKVHTPETADSPGYASLKTAVMLSGKVQQVAKAAREVSDGAANIEALYASAKGNPTLGWSGGSQRINTMMTGVYNSSAYRSHTAALNETLAVLTGAKTLDGYIETYNKLVPQAKQLRGEYTALCSQCATALQAYENAGTLGEMASLDARASAKRAISAALNFEDEKYRKFLDISTQQVVNIVIDKAHLDPDSTLAGYRRYLNSVAAGTANPVSAQNVNAMLQDAIAGNTAAVNARSDAAAWLTMKVGSQNAFGLMSSAVESERYAEVSQIRKSTAMESGQLICIGASFVPIPVVNMIGRAGLVAFSTYSILNSERNMVMDGKVNLTDMANIGVNLALAGVVSPFSGGTRALSLLSPGVRAVTQGTNLLLSGAVAVDMGMNISDRLKSGERDLRLAVDVGLLALSLGHFAGTSARMAGFDARVVRGEAEINFGQFDGRLNVGRVEVQTPFTGGEWVTLGVAGIFTGAPAFAAAWQVRGGPLHVFERGGKAPAETSHGPSAPSQAPESPAGPPPVPAAPSAAGLAASLGIAPKALPPAGGLSTAAPSQPLTTVFAGTGVAAGIVPVESPVRGTVPAGPPAPPSGLEGRAAVPAAPQVTVPGTALPSSPASGAALPSGTANPLARYRFDTAFPRLYAGDMRIFIECEGEEPLEVNRALLGYGQLIQNAVQTVSSDSGVDRGNPESVLAACWKYFSGTFGVGFSRDGGVSMSRSLRSHLFDCDTASYFLFDAICDLGVKDAAMVIMNGHIMIKAGDVYCEPTTGECMSAETFESMYGRTPSVVTSDRARIQAISLINRAAAQGASGDYQGAIESLDGAIALDASYAVPFNSRGCEKRSAGDLQGAIADYTEAMRLDPGDFVAVYNRGLARYEARDYEGAIEDFQTAARLNPNSPLPHYECAMARRAMGDEAGARGDLIEAVRRKAGSAEEYYARAKSNALLGNTRKAEEDWARGDEYVADYDRIQRMTRATGPGFPLQMLFAGPPETEASLAAAQVAAADAPRPGLLGRLRQLVQPAPEPALRTPPTDWKTCLRDYEYAKYRLDGFRPEVTGGRETTKLTVASNYPAEGSRVEVAKIAVFTGISFNPADFSIKGRAATGEVRKFERAAARMEKSPDRSWIPREFPEEQSRFELARIQMLVHPEQFRLEDYGITSQEYLGELANLGVDACPDVVIEQVAGRIESDNVLQALARRMANINPGYLAGHEALFRIEGDEALCAGIKAAADRAPASDRKITDYEREITEALKDFMVIGRGHVLAPEHARSIYHQMRTYDEQTRFEMAKVAAFRNLDASLPEMFGITLRSHTELLSRFREASVRISAGTADLNWMLSEFPEERDRYEVARLALCRDRFTFDLNNYRITDQNYLASLAYKCIEHGADKPIRAVLPLIDSEAARVDLAKLAVSGSQFFFLRNAEAFRLPPSKEWVELLKPIRAPVGHLLSNIPDERDRLELAEARINELYDQDNLADYNITDAAALQHLSDFQRNKIRERTANWLLSRAGIELLMEIPEKTGIPLRDILGDSVCHFGGEADVPFSRCLMALGEHLPTLLGEPELAELPPFRRYFRICELADEHVSSPKQRGGSSETADQFPAIIKDAFASEVQSERESAAILGWLIQHRGELPQGATPVELSRHALEAITGYAPFNRVKTGNPGEIYKVLLSLSDTFGRLPGRISIADECWSRQNLEKTKRVLSLIKALKGLSGSSWTDRTFSLEPGNLDTLNTELEGLVAEEFSRALGLETASGAAVAQLAEKWGGDLSPLTILVGRYSENSDWGAEVPVVREICGHVLDNTFYQYRYETEEAGQQLSMMTPQQVTEWRKNPGSLKYVEAEPAEKAAAFGGGLERAAEIVQRNLVPHLADAGIDNAPQRIQASEPDAVAQQLQQIDKEARGAAMIGSIMDALGAGELERARALTTYFTANSSRFTDNKPVAADIKSIKQALEPPREIQGKGYLIFSTITDDPHLMLMIGDMVDTASCQNYRTGHMIQTLPGYGIDANIKAELTWAVPSWQLSQNPAILTSLKETPEKVRVNFDPGKLTLTLSIKGSAESVEIPLDKAFRRHILRAGSNSSGNAAMLPEGGYDQNHTVEGEIEASARELIENFRKACGFQPAKGTLRFPASRNPNGVYSDWGGGVKVGPYEITVE